MFFVNNLTWNDNNGAKASNRGYNLNLNASSCIPNTTTTNGNHSSVMYVKERLFLWNENITVIFFCSLNLVWVNQKTPFDTVNMR